MAFFAKELRHAAKPRFPKQRLIAQLMRLPEDLCSIPDLGTATLAQILHATEALFSEPFVLRQVARFTLGGCVQSTCGVMADAGFDSLLGARDKDFRMSSSQTRRLQKTQASCLLGGFRLNDCYTLQNFHATPMVLGSVLGISICGGIPTRFKMLLAWPPSFAISQAPRTCMCGEMVDKDTLQHLWSSGFDFSLTR